MLRKLFSLVALVLGFSVTSAVMGAQEDTQKYQVYDWGYQVWEDAGSANITVNIGQAESIVSDIYFDYFVKRGHEPAVNDIPPDGRILGLYWKAYHRIELVDPKGLNLRILLHETAHALVQSSKLEREKKREEGNGKEPVYVDPGHGREFTSMLLDLWRRYAPFIDILDAYHLAVDYEDVAIDINLLPPLLPHLDSAVDTIYAIACSEGAQNEEFCEALQRPHSEFRYGTYSDRYLRYFSGELNSGSLYTRLAIPAVTDDQRPDWRTQLHISCFNDRLNLIIWLQGDSGQPLQANYRFGDEPSRPMSWHIEPHGTGWYRVSPISPWTFMASVQWASRAHDWFTIGIWTSEGPYERTFWIEELFHTEVQPNITSCGPIRERFTPG